MEVYTLSVGPMQANCYILECEETKNAIIIDPGGDGDFIIDFIDSKELKPEFIINTHAHIDHIAANKDLKSRTSALICIHEEDADMLVNPQRNLSFFIGSSIASPPPDRLLIDGDMLKSGTINLQVIHTPGHSPGSICLLSQECIFTGDLLFSGGIGRYDFPGSSYNLLIKSLKKIMNLDSDLIVYPGHGPATTIGEEKETNPFINYCL